MTTFFADANPLLEEAGSQILDETGADLLADSNIHIRMEEGLDAIQIIKMKARKDAQSQVVVAQALALTLFANTHYGPSATGDFSDPVEVDITVKPGTIEIRSPL